MTIQFLLKSDFIPLVGIGYRGDDGMPTLLHGVFEAFYQV
jgi:hypothetical protein